MLERLKKLEKELSDLYNKKYFINEEYAPMDFSKEACELNEREQYLIEEIAKERLRLDNDPEFKKFLKRQVVKLGAILALHDSELGNNTIN